MFRAGGCHARGECLDQRDDRRPGLARFLRDGNGIEILRTARAGYHPCRFVRYRAGRRCGTRERRLDVEHCLQNGSIGEEIRQCVGCAETVDQPRAHRACHQSAKNTVSPSPCRRMVNSHTAGSPEGCEASRVERRPDGTSAISGSSSRAASPEK